MTNEKNEEKLPRDHTGRRGLLRMALRDERLGAHESDPVGFQRAALRVTIALGYCRLFGVPCGRSGSTLPEPMARAAAQELERQLKFWTRPVPSWETFDPEPLPDREAELERWDLPVTGIMEEWVRCCCWEEADDMAGGWLRRRTDVLAAQIALAEAEKAIRSPDGAKAGPLTIAIQATESHVKTFDEQLQSVAVMQVLGTMTESNFIRNMRRQLVPPYNNPLPWWLDPATLPQTSLELPDEH
jgi:hypothetical protein